MVVSRDDADGILSPLLQAVWESVSQAVDDYKKLDSDKRAIFKTRTRANIINDLMVHYAAGKLAAFPGVQCGYFRQQFRVIIADARKAELLKLMFKLLDRRLLSRYIPTQQKLAFVNQLQPELPSLPNPVTNIIAGYRWNILQTEVDGVFIVCPNGRQNEWALEVSGPGASDMLQLPDVAPSPKTDGRRVVPKEDSKKKRERKDGAH